MTKLNPNPNAKPEQEEAGKNAQQDAIENSHRSINSQIEGGQNQYEGEPHPGYGSDQGQSQRGNND